jgi:hypothetical protein
MFAKSTGLISRRRWHWQQVVDDLADLSEIEVEQEGRRALLRTAPAGESLERHAVCRISVSR